MSVLHQKNDRILIVDDDPGMQPLVQGLMLGTAASVTLAGTLTDGLRLAGDQRFDIVILDHLLPDGQGLDIVADLIAQDRLRPILYITAQSGAHTAIEAIKRGAFDYLAKPLDFALLNQRLQEALEYRRLTRLPVLVDGADDEHGANDVLVGRCRTMQEVYKSIGRLASLNAPVLIEGEVGTGKEMIARAIHQYGVRQQAPFAKLRSEEFAAAMERCENAKKPEGKPSTSLAPATLTEAFSFCRGGTILIEEVSELAAVHQSRLLGLLLQQQRTEAAEGVRVIVSTSVPSRQLLERGTLRSDLYYFLSPYTVRVPALREREEDFELLIAHFMHRLAHVSATSEHQSPPRVSPAAMALLRQHDWPGNVAQLKSVLQSILMESRGAVLATDALRRSLDGGHEDTVSLKSTVPAAEIPSGALDLAAFVNERMKRGTDRLYEEVLGQVDKALLTIVLQHTRGNQAQAAKMLGMTRTSLRKKIALGHIDLSRLADVGSGSRTSVGTVSGTGTGSVSDRDSDDHIDNERDGESESHNDGGSDRRVSKT